MATQSAYHSRLYGNPVFDNGVRHGISWYLTGDEEYRPPLSSRVAAQSIYKLPLSVCSEQRRQRGRCCKPPHTDQDADD